jgi:hypothetical protein
MTQAKQDGPARPGAGMRSGRPSPQMRARSGHTLRRGSDARWPRRAQHERRTFRVEATPTLAPARAPIDIGGMPKQRAGPSLRHSRWNLYARASAPRVALDARDMQAELSPPVHRSHQAARS